LPQLTKGGELTPSTETKEGKSCAGGERGNNARAGSTAFEKILRKKSNLNRGIGSSRKKKRPEAFLLHRGKLSMKRKGKKKRVRSRLPP